MTPLLIIAGMGLQGLRAQHLPGNERVTLAGKQIAIADVFRSIWEQTGMQAFYNDEQLSSAEKIDVSFRNERLDQVLTTLLKKRRLTWYYREETFVILPVKDPPADAGKDEMMEKEVTITGTVTSQSDNTPIPVASIQIKGSQHGVHTDESGTFTLPVNGPTTLMIRSMGYDPKEITVSNKQPEHLKIRLTPAIKGLNEVLVIAYGTAIRRNLTGSVSRITAEDISQQPVANPLQAMQGRVTGLNIMQTSGLPGSDYKVELRGRNSISSGNNPFYIVDGVPFTATTLSWASDLGTSLGANMSSSPLNLINVADIESIDVLKDADATAIYGSRGANGVILITTKKGRKGPAGAHVSVYTGIGQVGHRVQYLNTQQYLQMRREAFANDGATPSATDYDMHWDSTRYTNWQREMIGGASRIMDAQANVSGGSEHAQFAMGAGYRRESTVYPGSFAYQKGAVSMRASFSTLDENKRGKALFSANYVTDRNQLPSTDLTVLSTVSPNAPRPYDENGVLNWEHGAFDNPYANLLKRYTMNSNNLLASAVLSYEVLPGLQVKTSMGYTRMQMNETQINPIISLNPSYDYASGYSLFADGNISSWIVEPQAIYEKKWQHGKHRSKLNVLAGLTFQQDWRSQRSFLGTGYTSDALLEDMTSAAVLTRLGVVNTQYRYNAAFGRINYILDERYILNLTGRRDGSSRFGPDNRFANFGAAGAAWIFSQEKWLKGLSPFLSFGKLRGSYGITGNDQITDYGYLDTYVVAPLYQDDRGLMASRLYNPAYSWEKNLKLEAGLELGFADDRVLFNVNWYYNRSSNQLVDYTLPGATGFPSIRRNLPALVSNTGYEFELVTTNISRGRFSWSSSLNLSMPRNKLVRFPGLQSSSYNAWYTEGQPLNVFKGAHLLGVDPKTGVYVFEDMNKDSAFTFPGDYTAVKKTGTLLYGGWQNSFQFRNWQLDVLFQYVKQNNFSYLYANVMPGMNANQPVSVLDRWQQPGVNTAIQQYTQSPGSPAGLAFAIAMASSDQMYNDASFIRLKNICLTYQLPAKWLKKCRLKNSQVFLQGQNVFTITRYPGIDPETAAQLETYPPLRSLILGLRFNFF
ncbi:SusC/RagA family TonB-linked outer membrane protein [Chitinophaga agrisoli]|nr:SusC/RagA family TonB-linked outer membrane protein [Chitinophaga agrisoli]